MILHLIIGSEGTLGFISAVTFRTLDEPTHKSTGLMLFPDIARACEAVVLLKDCQVSAAELMDRVSLRSVEDKPGMPSYIKSLGDTVTALLVETAADDTQVLQRQVDEINTGFADFPMVRDSVFSTDPCAGGSPVEYSQRAFSFRLPRPPKGNHGYYRRHCRPH